MDDSIFQLQIVVKEVAYTKKLAYVSETQKKLRNAWIIKMTLEFKDSKEMVVNVIIELG